MYNLILVHYSMSTCKYLFLSILQQKLYFSLGGGGNFFLLWISSIIYIFIMCFYL